VPALLTRAVWWTTAGLVVVGVAAAAWRAAFVADAGARAEPMRPPLLEAFGVVEPFPDERAQQTAVFDERFARHPLATCVHVVLGGFLLALAPLQFVSTLRNRHRAVHRWSGRFIVAAGALTAMSGLYFGLLMPFGGAAEAAAIALFGGLLLIALVRAVLAIRAGRVAAHREWMLRVMALSIAISVVRVVALPMDVLLTPLGFGAGPIFVISVWTGWLLSLGAAEAWIRRTRPALGSRAARAYTGAAPAGRPAWPPPGSDPL
jgi:uncharacterized membrane protein